VDRLLVILIAEGVGATVLVVIVAVWLSRRAVKPLQQVIDVAAEIEASDLRRRIGAKGQPAEVQKLADTFDAMLARLDEAFQEQRNFVSEVSHDLRTPLTALQGNIDVMLMEEALEEQSRSHLEHMSEEVRRLTRMTSNLLYLASADAGREPERRSVELDVVCLEVVRQTRDLRRDVKLSLGNEDQVTVMGDRDQLRQMILNLVENALKYCTSGGQVTLSLGQVGGAARIEVADTGPGISPDVLPHIFQRFYRGQDGARKAGTGLGLTIADRIARAHGGRIEAKSVVGEGSTFVVDLPMPADTSPAPAEAS
jgi:signal transduction histidine kinase